MGKSLFDILIAVPLMIFSFFLTNAGYPTVFQFSICALISFYLLFISSQRGIILFCALGVFGSAHYLFIPDLNLHTEPIYFKSIKDIFLLGLILNLIFKNKERKSYRIQNICFRSWALIAFMIIVFINILLFSQSGNFLASLVSGRYLIIYPALAYLSVGAFQRIEAFDRFFKILCMLGVIVSCIGFFEILTGHKTYYSGYIGFGIINQRMISTLLNPNNCALFLLIPIIYLFMRLLKKSGSTLINAVTLIILLSGLFFTFSRSAFVALCVGIIYLSAYSRSIRSIGLSFFAIGGGIGLAILTTLYRVNMQQQDAAAAVSSSFVGRLFFGLASSIASFWYQNNGMRLITGIGFGSPEMVVTDNMYTHILLGGGILALFFFVITMVSIFGQNSTAIKQSSAQLRGIVIVLGAIVSIIIVHMFSAVTIRLFPAGVFFWIFIGSIWSIRFSPNRSTLSTSAV